MKAGRYRRAGAIPGPSSCVLLRMQTEASLRGPERARGVRDKRWPTAVFPLQGGSLGPSALRTFTHMSTLRGSDSTLRPCSFRSLCRRRRLRGRGRRGLRYLLVSVCTRSQLHHLHLRPSLRANFRGQDPPTQRARLKRGQPGPIKRSEQGRPVARATSAGRCLTSSTQLTRRRLCRHSLTRSTQSRQRPQ